STPLKVRIVPRRQPCARTSPDDTRGQCPRLRRGLLGTARVSGRDDRAVSSFDTNLEPQHPLQFDAPSPRTECRAHFLTIPPYAFPDLRARAHHQAISLNEGSLSLARQTGRAPDCSSHIRGDALADDRVLHLAQRAFSPVTYGSHLPRGTDAIPV